MGGLLGAPFSRAAIRAKLNQATCKILYCDSRGDIWHRLSTGLSSIDGIPGGLLSPSLSVGAGIGKLAVQWMPTRARAQIILLGMTAYLTGDVQAPIASVVIMAEMTTGMVVPLLACAFIADLISKAIQAKSIYHALAEPYLDQKISNSTAARLSRKVAERWPK